ncbi:histidine phosphatase family protein [Nocardioides mangrovicus]|uniref:Histidine phosphatase family protein n=2 Tax=Nocardioides mangrovicus TaxID=2478913 RepID=A0A3L8P1L0_9ACTN|nr:histidine phosphatase family protein [Nocardioides mangrovicus]
MSGDDVGARRPRTLVLMRHAKAEALAAEDHARPLAERGHRDAAAAGAWLAEQEAVPTHALVSSATRTRETWQEVRSASGSSAEADLDDGLYSAGPDTALDLVRAAEASASVLAVVGHNPTMAYLAQALVDVAASDVTAFASLAQDFPTCATAVFEVDGDWSGVTEGSARLVGFFRP